MDEGGGSGLGRLGRYELLARLATGGMGEIFLARLGGEGGFEKLVVLKRLLGDLVRDEQFVSMFLDEARIAARLSHPNVCEVYELGQEEGHYFIAMQYLEGVPYGRLMEPSADDSQHARLVAGLVGQACEGLHHAHEARGPGGELLNVVHRDVSPSNLFVTSDGVVKVLDFGIAKARGASAETSRGTIKGKYQYMSPEQIRGDPLDRRSDVFSLGIVLHESLTGERLFDRGSEYLVAKAIIEEPVPRVTDVRPTVPESLDAVVARALASDPKRRYATARELGRTLNEAVADLGGPMPATDIAEELRRRFGQELRAQRQRYERATGAQLDSGPVLAPGTVSLKRPGTPATESLVPMAADDPRRARSVKRPLLALLAGALVISTIAVSLGLWRSRDPGPSPAGADTTTADAGAGPALATRSDAGARRDADALARAEPDAAPARPEPAAGDGPSSPPEVERRRPRHPERERGPRSGRRPRSEERTDRGPDEAASPASTESSDELDPGYLSVTSSPYATIYIDGEHAGVTPIIRRRLSPGRHRIRAVTKAGQTQTFTVEIEAGKVAPPQKLSW